MRVSVGLLKAEMRPCLDYEDYLWRFGILDQGFVIGELVRARSPRHELPPKSLWPAMVPTLALAVELRARMVAAGARGLSVAAAFRPLGGESDSQHKHNGALDLDLLPGDQHLSSVYARAAAELWREHEDLRVGLGTYAPERALWTKRVHIDTGHRFRCWQGTGSHTFAARPAALTLAPPDETDLENLDAVADGT